MTMSQLAFDENGEPVDLPPTAAGWRVRRMKGTRSAPGLVYGSDGAPLVLPLDVDIEELRREVWPPADSPDCAQRCPASASVPAPAPLRFQLVPLHHLRGRK